MQIMILFGLLAVIRRKTDNSFAYLLKSEKYLQPELQCRREVDAYFLSSFL